MYSRIFVVLCLLLCSYRVASAAQDVAYVDLAYLLEQAPQAVAASRRLQEAFQPREEQIASLREQIETLRGKLSTGIEETLAEDELELRRLERDFRRMEQEFREDLSVQKNAEYKRVRAVIIQALSDYAQSEQIGMIVSEGALYVASQVDITAKVLNVLEGSEIQ